MVTSTSEVYGTAQYVPIDESIHFRDSLRIPRQKSEQIVWQKAFTAALIFRLQLSVRSTLMVQDSLRVQ